MGLRSTRERIAQTLCFEASGWITVAPAYSLLTGTRIEESATLLVAVSIAITIWAMLHNTVFDKIEFGLSGRLASDRPHHWRIVQAFSMEISSILATMPLIMWLSGFDFWQTLAVNAGLTVAYTGYGYAFHLLFDHMRPVR